MEISLHYISCGFLLLTSALMDKKYKQFFFNHFFASQYQHSIASDVDNNNFSTLNN